MAHDSSDAASLASAAGTPLQVAQLTDWTTAPLRELIAHLTAAHRDYFRVELPALQQRLDAVVAKYGHAEGVLRPLARVFESLRMDLMIHMEKEELMLFPAIERYERAMDEGKPLSGSPFAAFGGPVNVMEHEHESAGAAIRLIRDFTDTYAPPAQACSLYLDLIDSLKRFAERLTEHMNLENNVLFARAAALNSRRQKPATTK